jgi:hypothetical protein
MTAAQATTTQTTTTGWVLRIGSTAGIAGALLGMAGNLIHPATPIGDPEGVAATIAGSRIWVPGHLAIVVGLMLILVTLDGIAAKQLALYPRWLGWVVMAAGIGSVAAGLLQAAVGEPTTLSRVLTIIFPTVITLWLVDMNVLVLRRAASLERAAARET